MTLTCSFPGCKNPVDEGREYCVGCFQHRQMMDLLTRQRPVQASPRALGVDRFCGNCAFWIKGERVRDWDLPGTQWKWDASASLDSGDCRSNAPRAMPDGGRGFGRTHREDWCRHHTMKRTDQR